MKTITKSLIVIGIVAVVGTVSAPAKAMFYQPYQPSPYYSYPTYYSYTTDQITPLIGGTIGFVSNFTYQPAPIHPYFYNYGYNLFSAYSPYSYGYGYSYGMDYGWGY